MHDKENYFKANKVTWNENVKVHAKSNMYTFIKGKSSLITYELDALGDVKGKSLLHL